MVLLAGAYAGSQVSVGAKDSAIAEYNKNRKLTKEEHDNIINTPELFKEVYGDVIDTFTVNGINGKRYVVIKCTEGVYFNLPRPENIEEFNRCYEPAVRFIMEKLAGK